MVEVADPTRDDRSGAIALVGEAEAGFKGIEYLFPYVYKAAELKAWKDEAGLFQAEAEKAPAEAQAQTL